MSERCAVLYAGKSTRDEHGSIPTQLKDGRVLAAANRWTVVGEYSDEDASAYHGNRGPGLAGAMAHCERLEAPALIVQHSDRLARGNVRDARHLVEIVVWAIRHGVKLVSKQDPATFADDDTAILMGAIAGSRNHEDSRRKSQAVRDGMRRRAESGKLPGGPPPYGFRSAAELSADGRPLQTRDGRIVKSLEPVPEQVAVVERIFLEWVDGRPQQDIARGLNREGQRSRNGVQWRQCTIRRILTNPVYVGKLRKGKNGDVIAGAHEPVLDEQLWNAARARFQNQQVTTGRHGSAKGSNNGGGQRGKGAHLLTKGLLRCGYCGGAMGPRSIPSRVPGKPASDRYHCLVHYRDPQACPQTPIARELVDEALLSEVTTRYLDLEATRERLRTRRQSDARLAAEALTAAESDLTRAESSLQRVKRDYVEGKITAHDWGELRVELTAEKDAAASAVERQRLRVTTVTPEAIDAEEETLRRLAELRDVVGGKLAATTDLQALRFMLRQVFDSIELIETDGGLALYPKPRAEILTGHGFVRTPLPLETADAPSNSRTLGL